MSEFIFVRGDRVKVVDPTSAYCGKFGAVIQANESYTRVTTDEGMPIKRRGDAASASFELVEPIASAETPEAIAHPAHYGGDTTYEVIKVIEAWGLGFALGNTTKYIARAGKKDPAAEVQDLRKAAFYLDRRIQQLEAGE